MDKLITTILGKMPIVLNDFRFADNFYRVAFESYLKALKAENCILYGCKITNVNGDEYEVSEGAVAINAEVFVCSQAKFTATNLDKCFFTIFESFDPSGLKIFGNNEKHNTYLLRRVKIIQYDEQPANTLSVKQDKLEDMLIYEGDSRLSDSRKCNNTFDDASVARNNLNVYSKSEVDNKLDNKVDKVPGKQLSTNDFTNALKNKLDNIANNANNYTHPSSHPITMINDAGNYVKMTTSERSKFPITMINDAGNYVKMTKGERSKLNGIASNANNYTHPASHSINMITDSSTHVRMTSTERQLLYDLQFLKTPQLYIKRFSQKASYEPMPRSYTYNATRDYKIYISSDVAGTELILPHASAYPSGLSVMIMVPYYSQKIVLKELGGGSNLFYGDGARNHLDMYTGAMLICTSIGTVWFIGGRHDID